jgi:membrane-associated protein
MLHALLDPISIIKFAGVLGVIAIVFAESGLFFGFFFPGDSLLFTAGFLASQGLLSFYGLPHGLPTAVILFLGIFTAAAAGDSVGYAFGRRTGPSLFSREDSLFFNKKYPARAEAFYEKYGKKTIILARFVPAVRTFAPIVAGIGSMDYRTFLAYNIAGAALWTLLLAGGGFLLGNTVPQAGHYISLIVLAIIVISILPPIVHFIKEKMAREKKQKI